MASSDQLTIRSIGSRLRTALEQEAARRGQSLNKTVLALLAESLGLADSAAQTRLDPAPRGRGEARRSQNEAMAGAQVAIELADSPSREDKAVLESLETPGRNATETAAGVRHLYGGSVVFPAPCAF